MMALAHHGQEVDSLPEDGAQMAHGKAQDMHRQALQLHFVQPI
jgi:hypothetical protein